jgi:Glycosyltransferase like family/Methyltransferase domain
MQSTELNKWLQFLAKFEDQPVRVFELGCGDGELAYLAKQRNPHLIWWATDRNSMQLKAAKGKVDHIVDWPDKDSLLPSHTDPFTIICLRDGLEVMEDRNRFWDWLGRHSSSHSRLLCHVVNAAHLSIFQKLAAGVLAEISQPESRLGFTYPTITKEMLDGGWMPNLIQGDEVSYAPDPFLDELVKAACKLGISEQQSQINFVRPEFWIEACRSPWSHRVGATQAPVSIIVPVNRDWQFQWDLLASPGLREMEVEVIVIRDATSAADVYQRGTQKAKHPWRLMLHQDVYIPKGSGHLIAQKLAQLSQAGLEALPVGFIGVESVPGSSPILCRRVGSVIDRTRRYIYQESESAVAIDELAIAIHTSSPWEIDEKLGWHLWATDLCLQVTTKNHRKGLPIINVPLYHNTIGSYQTPEAYVDSGCYLLDKYPQLRDIPTVFGNLGYASNGDKRFDSPLRAV